MRIGEIIKEKRLMKGLTQEQLADYLGISAPAVSKWEKAVSHPDIALLPPLARLLDTDLNTLLSFHTELTKQEVIVFLNEMSSQGISKGTTHAFEMAMTKIHEYPSCDLLILNTAMTLEGLLTMSTEEDQNVDYMHEIENLYERAAESRDSQIRHQAQAMLISRYTERKEYENAEKLMSELPDTTMFDKRRIQANMYMAQERWADAASIIEQKLLTEASSITSALLFLMEISIKEGRSSDADQIAATVEQTVNLFGLWDYNTYGAYFQLALLEKDVVKSIVALKGMFSSLLTKWNISENSLFRHIAKEQKETNLGEILLPKLLSDLENPQNMEYDFLRENAEFIAYITEFKKNMGDFTG